MMEPKHRPHGPSPLRVIAVFKFLKGAGLLAIGVGAFSLVHRDVAEAARRVILFFHFDPDNHFFRTALNKLANVDARKLEEVGAGTFFYASLLLTEGVGLWFRQTWAEYLAIFATSAFIPLEIYSLFHRYARGKIVVILINVAIVAYLIFEVRRNRRLHQHK